MTIAPGTSARGVPRRRVRPLALAGLLVFGAAFCLLFRAALFSGHTFVERDLPSFWRPLRAVAVRIASAEGALPLWNPLLAHGQPLAANPQYALFHPLTTLFLVLPFAWAFRLQVLLPVAFAALWMRVLLVELRLGRAAALAGALSWGLGACVLGSTSILPFAFACAALPLYLTGIARGARRGVRAGLVPGACGLGLIVLAGQPEPILVAIGLAFPVMAVTAGRAPRWAVLGRALLPAAAATALGLLLGAATLVPGLDLVRKTVRAGGLSASESLAWSFPPERLVELAVPRAFGRLEYPANPDDRSPALYPDVGRPMHFLYPGLPITVLAVLAACWRPRRGLPWLIAGALFLLLASGRHVPLLPLALRLLPAAALLRFPEKVLFAVAFSVTVLGAVGLDEMGRRRGRPRAAALALVGVAGALAAASLVARVAATSAPALARRAPSLLAEDLAAGAFVALLGAAGLTLASWPKAPPDLRPLRLVPLLAVLSADLVFHGRGFVATRPERDVATPPPPFDRLPTDVSRRTFHLAALEYSGSTLWMAPPPVPSAWGIPLALPHDFSNTELAWSRRVTEAILALSRDRPDLLEPLLARRGVAAVVAFHPRVRAGPDGVDVPPGLESPLVAVPVRGAAPLAFFAREVVVARGVEGWTAAVRGLGAAAAATAVVDPAELPRRPPALAAGRVPALRVTPARLSLEVDVSGPGEGLLLVNQTWDSGWRARLDGRDVRLLRADLSLCALFVPPGRHAVELVYHAPLVIAGLALSTVAVATLLLSAFARPSAA